MFKLDLGTAGTPSYAPGYQIEGNVDVIVGEARGVQIEDVRVEVVGVEEPQWGVLH